ncbi:hypothetical protein PISMIDRAFT_17543 [Pisolithus microcarpus 441]|uniref:Uncharacterized protein n=1 Tax=Pisolithus microcarpus 441 TaxID=765257 RepID=A0A0C9YV97_9AGAM|nr:hypothetical protein PISMIDRAFT_17543 [Pisolithus microcarpus 441]
MSLMQAYELSLRNRPGDGRCGAFDARVLAKYNDHWITSPSAEYVPQPFIFEGARVEPLRDGRFSHIDCFQWPQLHAECYVWSACIPRKSAYQDDPMWKWLWWNVTQSAEDFVLEGGSAFKVGRIHADKWKLLETAYNRLDAWAQDWIQKKSPLRRPSEGRCMVVVMPTESSASEDVFGMLDYLQTVLPPADGTFIDGFDRWIGAFTTDPEEYMKVIKEVEVTCPDDIVTDPEEFEVGQVLKWKGGWCYPGDARHLHTRDTPVIGLEQFARPWPEPSARSNNSAMASTPSSTSPAALNAASSSGENSSTGAVRTERSRQRTKPYRPAGSTPRAKPAIIPNPDLWEDINDPAIPPAMSVWHAALKDVVKDVKRVRPNVPKVAYFFPNPVLFVRGESSDRRQRYMRNWLVSRAGWISRLSASDVSPVSPRSWRDFLNTIPERFSATFSGEQQREAAAFFGPELIRVQHDIPSHVQFRDLSICIADLASIDQLTKSKILWDLYEHNFRFELVALGHMLMPGLSSNREPEWLDLVRQLFPGDSELTMCAEPFPTQNQGLGSSDP